MLLIALATAQAAEGLARCTVKLKTPEESYQLQAFGPDFEVGMARAVEHAWLMADLHQHPEVHLGDTQALVGRYAGIEPTEVPRLPGYEVVEDRCEVVQLQRHEGDWHGRWYGEAVQADQPWVALEAARRRSCFQKYGEGAALDISKARHALFGCMMGPAKAPTPAGAGTADASPRYICRHDEGWVGGGLSLDAAREDALTSLVIGRSRAGVGAALEAVGAQEMTPKPGYDFVVGTRKEELASLSCSAPERNLRFSTTSECAGASTTLTATLEATSTEIAAMCHDAQVEPTLALVPSAVESGLPLHMTAGAVGLANRCDAECRSGFR